MSNSVWPHRRQPTRLPHPWDSPGKNTGVGCHFLLQCTKVKSESEVAQSRQPSTTPWTAAFQAPPSMRFSRQGYWSGVPLPSPLSMYRIPKFFRVIPNKEYSSTNTTTDIGWRVLPEGLRLYTSGLSYMGAKRALVTMQGHKCFT